MQRLSGNKACFPWMEIPRGAEFRARWKWNGAHGNKWQGNSRCYIMVYIAHVDACFVSSLLSQNVYSVT